MSATTFGQPVVSEATEPPKSRNKKSRFQFEISERSVERLNSLKDRTEATSYSEVVKNALKLYDGMVEARERGDEFFVKDKFGTVSAYKMFL